MAKRSAPEINAGSMADIAFLLLIFFLVTTTIDKDKGLVRQLPPPLDEEIIPPIIKQKNLFVVLVNSNNDLLVEDEPMELKDLRQAAKDFLDNGGIPAGQEGHCNYCQGARSPSSSDNPDKAIISMSSARKTDYTTYIAVQNELGAAYNELRDRESQRLFGWKYTEVKAAIDAGNYEGNEEKAKEKLKQVRALIPFKLSEAEPKSN
ncbi:biopolymer transporter ExbD [Dokdonia pacifica]|uniref:Biopolymer transport protein ExbD/TolR n=1 Tax=Dokdonia pacifica TaxID=1627892 RepID=A0A239AF12_9FLAO|nr:biopolymer transporter ExbD [Dokdonia pacifica]GGG38087.1 biopolymer transporter ExbD [Dokdonia pacifica]SNR93644.1 Biopolymer transport protein ExbD/TolR [Dokdonia pacifica]